MSYMRKNNVGTRFHELMSSATSRQDANAQARLSISCHASISRCISYNNDFAGESSWFADTIFPVGQHLVLVRTLHHHKVTTGGGTQT